MKKEIIINITGEFTMNSGPLPKDCSAERSIWLLNAEVIGDDDFVIENLHNNYRGFWSRIVLQNPDIGFHIPRVQGGAMAHNVNRMDIDDVIHRPKAMPDGSCEFRKTVTLTPKNSLDPKDFETVELVFRYSDFRNAPSYREQVKRINKFHMDNAADTARGSTAIGQLIAS